jgi:ABC-type transport system involved in multi-copper enzyme maturation permease subunit
MKLIVLTKREFVIYGRSTIFLILLGVISTAFLWFATSPETFLDYADALPIAFAMACAAMLIGMMMSINLVCKDYHMIRRELRMGISVSSIILSKTLLNVFFSAIMSAVLIIPYFTNSYRIEGQNTIYLYFAVFLTMLASAQIGLLLSTLVRDKAQVAALAIPFVLLYKILFSGFVFDQVQLDNADVFAISNYSIRAIGSALRFDHEHFGWDTPYGVFINSPENALANLGALMAFAAIPLILSIFTLWLIDKKGWN